jgi:hypothetical protein
MLFPSVPPRNEQVSLLAYEQATPQQRAQALQYLQQRLQWHFPTLAAQTWADALTLFQPDLWVAGEQVTLADLDLRQLTQYLADSPELPLLDPPLYPPAALELAQQLLHAAELAVYSLPDLEALSPVGGRRLYSLVSYLARGNRVAEQVVQAWRWGLAVGRPLPLGMPGGGPAPGSPEAEQRLLALKLSWGSSEAA